MFLAGDKYFQEIVNIFSENSHIDLAVAFWGKGADALVVGERRTARVICQLRGGGTNPEPIRNLRNNQNVEIRALDSLHAKVVIGSKTAIVGSANFSTNGLGYEGKENQGWSEAGLLVCDEDDVKSSKAWFDDMWSKAVKITDDMLKQAEDEWLKRQANKPIHRKLDSFFQLQPEELEYKNIHVCVCSEHSPPKAREIAEEYSVKNGEGNVVDLKLEAFTNWDSMREGQKLISVFIGPQGGLSVDGPYEVIYEGAYEEDGENNTIFLAMPLRDKRLAGCRFGRKELDFLKKAINKDGLNVIENKDIVPMHQFLQEHTSIYQ